jgi:hypothetical protein
LDNDVTLTPTEPTPPIQPSTLRKIFIGKDGLRASWSLLIFIAICAVLLFVARVISHKIHPPVPGAAKAPSDMSIAEGYLMECIPLLITLLGTWIMSKIERRSNSVYGLGDRRKLSHFLAGLAWGMTAPRSSS